MIKSNITNVSVMFEIYYEDNEFDIMTVTIDGPERLVHKMTDLVELFDGDEKP